MDHSPENEDSVNYLRDGYIKGIRQYFFTCKIVVKK